MSKAARADERAALSPVAWMWTRCWRTPASGPHVSGPVAVPGCCPCVWSSSGAATVAFAFPLAGGYRRSVRRPPHTVRQAQSDSVQTRQRDAREQEDRLCCRGTVWNRAQKAWCRLVDLATPVSRDQPKGNAELRRSSCGPRWLLAEVSRFTHGFRSLFFCTRSNDLKRRTRSPESGSGTHPARGRSALQRSLVEHAVFFTWTGSDRRWQEASPAEVDDEDA